ncbi:MAG: SLBB domain-containing protein [Planctomycetes bacterium]|nr:SLBB domain-containing protein [Planctomycetota bacterium]
MKKLATLLVPTVLFCLQLLEAAEIPLPNWEIPPKTDVSETDAERPSLRKFRSRPESAADDTEQDTPREDAVEEPSRFQAFLETAGLGEVDYYGMALFRTGSDYGYYHRPVPADYLVGPGDEMTLRIWGKVDIREVIIVDPEGRVDLPYVGPVMVAGKRMSDVRQEINKAVSTVFTDFKLDVTVTRLRTIEVMVAGEVGRPGVYRVGAGAGVLQVLTMAGGPLPTGSMRSVRLVRKNNALATIDLYNLLMKGEFYRTGELLDSDIVFVPAARAHVAVLGGVRRPFIYEVLNETGLESILSLAGGLDFTATRNKVVVHRMDGAGRLQPMEYAPANTEYRPENGDVVVVPEPPSTPARIVRIEGAVQKPGDYPFHEGMRLNELVELAGGLRDNSYRRGAVFTRVSIKTVQQERIDDSVQDLELRLTASAPDLGSSNAEREIAYLRSLVSKLKAVKATGRVTIDLEAALDDAASDSNIVLEPGDLLEVPIRPSTVTVVGAVHNQTGVIHSRDMNVRKALESIGGMTENADTSHLYVLMADGTVVSQNVLRGGGYMWNREKHRWQPRTIMEVPLLPGDTVVVPTKLERRVYPMTLAKDISQILYNIALSTGVLVTVF